MDKPIVAGLRDRLFVGRKKTLSDGVQIIRGNASFCQITIDSWIFVLLSVRRGMRADEVGCSQLSSARNKFNNSIMSYQTQQVQNAAAQLIVSLSRRSHINPALKLLHWLKYVATLPCNLSLTLMLYKVV